MWLDVDGSRMQDGSTKTMIFGVQKLVSYVSHFITLHPGDVISHRHPAGRGPGQEAGRRCSSSGGETMRLGIEGLGEQTQRVVAA